MSARSSPRFMLIAMGLMASLGVAPAGAATVYTAQVSGAVDFEAQFTLTDNTITVQLTNDMANTANAGLTLRSIAFDLSEVSSTGSITAFTGVNRTIDGKKAGQYTDTATTSTDWSFSGHGSYLLTSTGPDYLVIGDPDANNAYSAANGSITNGPHNPHLANSPLFTLNIPGVTDTLVVSNVVFGYGTSNDTIAATSLTSSHHQVVAIPEPASLGMASVLLTALAAARAPKRR